jgi:signal transduction histidine kinase
VRVNFGKRLVPLSALGVGALFVGVVFAMGLFAFGAYVDHVRRDARSLLAEAVFTAESLRGNEGAADAAHAIAARFIQPALLVVFVDRRSRVTVLRESTGSGGTRASILVRARDDRRLPEADGVIARITLGLGTAFGLTALHAHAARLDITVDENQVRFVEDVGGFFPAFAVAIVLAIAIAAATARVLTRSALRPLDEVTQALQRFSAGDFTPEFIESDGNERLGALALAYNGAVEQVERSFAERARANAMMRQFIADAGHQLRTPLTVIRGFVGIVRSQSHSMSPSEIEHILEAMGEQTLVMSALIDKLILLDQLESNENDLRVTDLSALSREIVAPFSLAHPNRSIVVDAPESEHAALDPSDVRHVLSNLIDNALKYTAGRVSVSVRATSEPDAQVVVRVSDAGPGMSAKQVGRAFDRFFRGRRRDVVGSGLGLAIAKRAAERSGGTLTIESDVERGTSVILSFPRSVPNGQPE